MLIIIGLGLIATQSLWVPKIVGVILQNQTPVISQSVSNTENLQQSIVVVPVPNNWIYYDGGNWSISYPPTWTLSKLPGDLSTISLKYNGTPMIGIDFGSLDSHPEADGLKQYVAAHLGSDYLDAMLNALTNLYSAGANTIVSSQKITIGTTTAAQFIVLDPGYTNQVTFISPSNYQVDFILGTATTTNPDPSVLNNYYTILSSFKSQ